MSDDQWAGLLVGDESYASARSFFHFEEVVRDISGFPNVIPTHQGRAAEHLLFKVLLQEGAVVPSNSHFDTTWTHIRFSGGTPIDLAVEEASDLRSDHPFKGNIDLGRLERLLQESDGGKIPAMTLTITNNLVGGQPASLENIRATAALCRRYGVKLFLDAARFAENAWFIQQREPGMRDRRVRDIAREVFDLADGCTMSAKKDGLVNIGGFIACRDDELAARIKEQLIAFEGFPTYGGLAGRDLEAIARGLREVLDEDYLSYRIGQVARFADRAREARIAVRRPVGGHAVYLDAKALVPHIPPLQFPGHAVAVALLPPGWCPGQRVPGTMLRGKVDPATGEFIPAPEELVRLAIPRRVYSNSHLEYVVDICDVIRRKAASLKGLRYTHHAAILGHFTARFEEIP